MSGILAWFMGLLAIIPGMGHPAVPSWNGYVEDDYVYAAASSAGQIAAIPVSEGQLVKKGDVLFVLEASQQQAQADAAKAQAAAAQASLANLQSGSRPEEIAVIETQLQKAQADLALAQQTLSRALDLYNKGNGPQSSVDNATSAVESATSAVATLQAQIAVARLPARTQQQDAAQAQLLAARAQAAQAQAALTDRTVTAPEDARIEKLFFKTGEVANAGIPVASLSGVEALKIIFYLSEGDRQQFALGDVVSVSCDGCAAGLTATISHFASDPQFTPPIIYSRDERNRLVFETEAILLQQNGILPGQPVTIERSNG